MKIKDFLFEIPQPPPFWETKTFKINFIFLFSVTNDAFVHCTVWKTTDRAKIPLWNFFFLCHSEFITFLICRCLLNICIVKYMYMYLEQKFLTAYLILRCTERLSKSEYHLRSFEISYNSTPIKYSSLYFP